MFFIDGIGQLAEGVVLVVGLLFAADHFQQVAFPVVKPLFGTDRVARRVVYRSAGQAHQAIYGLGHDGAAGVADMHRHLPLITVVADAPLAGDQYGSESVGFVYPVFEAGVFRVDCAVVVLE